MTIHLEPISRKALPRCARSLGKAETGGVVLGHDDFDAAQLEFGEGELTECLNGGKPRALALPGLADPIAQVAEPIDLVELIETTATHKGIGPRVENAEFVAGTTLPLGLAMRKPSHSIGGCVIAMRPGHPLPHSGGGLQNGLNEGWEIGFNEGAEPKTTGGMHGAGHVVG